MDIDAVGNGIGDAGLPHGAELLAFAEAVAGFDDERLASARSRLVERTDAAFMIDAAAVAANFEMMTRVADGTGARFAPAMTEAREQLGERLGVHWADDHPDDEHR